MQKYINLDGGDICGNLKVRIVIDMLLRKKGVEIDSVLFETVFLARSVRKLWKDGFVFVETM